MPNVCVNICPKVFPPDNPGKAHWLKASLGIRDPSHLVEVADGHRGKVDLIEGSGGVTD